jgi:hypothetical protein
MKLHSVPGDAVRANVIGVRHSTRFEHVEAAMPLAVLLEAPQQDPGVHERRNIRIGRLLVRVAGREAREESRDMPRLEMVDESQKCRFHGIRGAG